MHRLQSDDTWLLERWRRLRMQVRCGLYPDQPGRIRLFVHCGLRLARIGDADALGIHRRALQTLIGAAEDEALRSVDAAISRARDRLPLGPIARNDRAH